MHRLDASINKRSIYLNVQNKSIWYYSNHFCSTFLFEFPPEYPALNSYIYTNSMHINMLDCFFSIPFSEIRYELLGVIHSQYFLFKYLKHVLRTSSWAGHFRNIIHRSKVIVAMSRERQDKLYFFKKNMWRT